jgi:hypothetical protein
MKNSEVTTASAARREATARCPGGAAAESVACDVLMLGVGTRLFRVKMVDGFPREHKKQHAHSVGNEHRQQAGLSVELAEKLQALDS